MSKRYAIWNKTDDIYTPAGPKLTAAQWIERYGWAGNPNMTVIVSAGPINGSMIDELSRMKARYEAQGATFDEGLSNQQLLDAIEAWEDEKNAEAAARAAEPTAEERIAAAMEYQNLLSL